jgi:hypothetical protein
MLALAHRPLTMRIRVDSLHVPSHGIQLREHDGTDRGYFLNMTGRKLYVIYKRNLN